MDMWTSPILTGWEANLTWQIMGLSLMVCKMHLRVKSIGDKSSINTANIPHPYAHMLSPSSPSAPSWLHPPGRYSANVWLHPQSSHWLLFFFSTRWLNQKTFSEKKKEDWRFFRKTIRETEESIGLSLHEFLKSFVANHETWPHYFSLMSCHTWQKCDMENTCRLSVSICSFPLVPSSLLGLHGIRARGGGCGRDRVQRRCRFITDQKESGETFTKHPDSLPFYLRDRLMKQMATCAGFLPAVEMAKGWGGKTEREKIEKRTFPALVAAFPISVTAANQNPNFYGACRLASFHLFSFIPFVVAHLWKLKAKACDSCWELNCHKLPLLTGWWITIISASPLI